MEDPSDKPHPASREEVATRPLVLSGLCLFTWTSYTILTVLYLLGLLYRSWIIEVFGQYIPDSGWTGTRITLFFLAGFLFHVIAIVGVVLMWKLRRIGYTIFTIFTLLIACSYLFSTEISWTSFGFYLILILLFTLFYSRMD